MSRKRCVVKAVNSFVSLLVIVALLTAGVYAAYALWDNQQVYEEARDVQLQMQELKPDTGDTDSGPSFAELQTINPDVCGWITMDGTQIDFPVVQGETNLTYINTDVYGSFALAGSIFLDCRNSGDFSDAYQLLYGHHMADSHMFGDLELYEDAEFFREHTTGTLMTPDQVYDLHVVACLVISASDDGIFDVSGNCEEPGRLVEYVRQNAVNLSDAMPAQAENVRFLALSTCSSDFTDARTIVLTIMTPRK